jgi:hypothetical protein
MIEHDYRASTGAQHSMNFIDGLLRVRGVMQHAV